MRKKLGIVVAIVFVGFLGWRVVTLIRSAAGPAESQRGSRPPVAVQVADPVRETIQDVRNFTGTVNPLFRYVVSPKVSGRVIELRKRIGDTVTRGEVIARIDDAEYQQAMLEADANLRIARANLAETTGQAALAAQELERARSLQDKGIASPAELDTAISNNSAQASRLETAKAQVEQREAALKSAGIRLGYTVLTAPEPGLVGERFVDEGALLAPNSPVITVVGIDRVIIGATIIERDYGRLNVGQSAEVTVDAFPGEAFLGTISRIAPMLEESSRVAKMEVEVANPARVMKPGMFARVAVVLDESPSTQVVPAAALVSDHVTGGYAVYVIETSSPPVARYVPVEVGILTTTGAEIRTPVLDGQVVTLGQHLLVDGSPVILPDSGDAGGGAAGGRGGAQ